MMLQSFLKNLRLVVRLMALPVEKTVEEATRLLGPAALLAMGLQLFRQAATVHLSVRLGLLGLRTSIQWVLMAVAVAEEEEEEEGMTRIQVQATMGNDLIDLSRPTS
jgi:hypothetical protein